MPRQKIGDRPSRLSEASKESNEEGDVQGMDPAKATATLASIVQTSQDFNFVTPADDIIDLKNGQRLVCIGDVHGDFTAFQEFLTIAGVYDKDGAEGKGGWIGGNTILVQCGGIMNHGSEELRCLSLMAKLSREAAAAGGAVIMLFGNHEMMNAYGDFRFATGEEEFEETLGRDIDRSLNSTRWRLQYGEKNPVRFAAMESGGILAKPFLSKLKVAVKVGSTVCVHGGLDTKMLDRHGDIERLNRQAMEWIEQPRPGVTFDNFGEYPVEEDVKTAAEQRSEKIMADMPEFLAECEFDSPLWLRDYSSRRILHPSASSKLEECLFRLDANRMVVGHVVQSNINGADDGKIWRIDVGASKGMRGNAPEVLEVRKWFGMEFVSILTRKGTVRPRASVIDVLKQWAVIKAYLFSMVKLPFTPLIRVLEKKMNDS